MKVRYNDSDEHQYCVECKELIEIGEKYAIVTENVLGEKIKKTYHLNCVPAEDSDINGLLDEHVHKDELVEDYGDE